MVLIEPYDDDLLRRIRDVRTSADPDTGAEAYLKKVGATDRIGQPIPIFVQGYKNLKTGVIARHPNDPDMHLFSTWDVGSIVSSNDVIKDSSVVIDASGKVTHATFESDRGDENLDRRKQILDLYQRLMDNAAVNPRWTYQMEFGIGEEQIWLYQLKPFLPVIIAPHTVPSDDELGQLWTHRASLSFGVLPPEGVQLPVIRLPTGDSGPSDYVHKGAKDFGDNEIEKEAIEFWRTGKIGEGWSGYADIEAAMEWGKTLDAQFPRGYCALIPKLRGYVPVENYLSNARVVVGLDYPIYDVLNHDLTRVITSYPNVIFGVSSSIWNKVKTGETIKIHSNGRESLIYTPEKRS